MIPLLERCMEPSMQSVSSATKALHFVAVSAHGVAQQPHGVACFTSSGDGGHARPSRLLVIALGALRIVRIVAHVCTTQASSTQSSDSGPQHQHQNLFVWTSDVLQVPLQTTGCGPHPCRASQSRWPPPAPRRCLSSGRGRQCAPPDPPLAALPAARLRRQCLSSDTACKCSQIRVCSTPSCCLLFRCASYSCTPFWDKLRLRNLLILQSPW